MGRLRRLARSVVMGLVLACVTAFVAPPSVDFVRPLLYGGSLSSSKWPGRVTAYGDGGWRIDVTYDDFDSPRSFGIFVRIDNLGPSPAPNFQVDFSEDWLPPMVARFNGPTVNFASASLLANAPVAVDEALATRIATGARASITIDGQQRYDTSFRDVCIRPPGRRATYPVYVLDWWRDTLGAPTRC